jgi:putative transcriptional regulator
MSTWLIENTDLAQRTGYSMKNRVRYYRLLRDNMTQEQLARAVGVTRQTIISMEGGEYNPSVALAIKLAKALGVTVEELFFLGEE